MGAAKGLSVDMTPEQLEQIVTAAVERAMKGKEISCACGLSPEAQRELGHFMGVVRYLGGEGNEGYAKGAEVFRKNNDFVAQWRAACEKTGSIILRVIVIACLGGAGTLGFLGIREWIKKLVEK